MNSNKKPTFFEPKTIIALILTMVVFVLWQNHMKTKYPQIYSSKAKSTGEVNPGKLVDGKAEGPNTNLKKDLVTGDNESVDIESTKAEAKSKIVVKESFTTFETENWYAKISNMGLEFKTVELKEYKERSLTNVGFKNLFKTTMLGSDDAIPFTLSKREADTIVGTYSTETGTITKTLKFNPKNYSIFASYEIKGVFPGLSVFVSMPVKPDTKSSFLVPSFDKQEYVVINSEDEDRDVLSLDDFGTKTFNQVKLVSLGSQFFSNAIVDESSPKPDAVLFADQISKRVFARLDYQFSNNLKSYSISQTYFAGPKDDVILNSVDKQMSNLINFGMFKVICEPILYVLKFFYSIFSNYGIAIILLTLLMRLLVFPIAYRGYKSMDKMQKIQPQLKAIREKYKDDSQKANLETMALMKEKKVNPVGGCLPMLIQLPIFFAFYRVLSESIVMYQAPFMLWIDDLSLKDPYYVLPVLMGLTMFIQQKLTPTALEPMQQKVMLFMPVIFSVFMISLPSALTLYIFVSTLFGVLQQYLFTKSKTQAMTAVKGV